MVATPAGESGAVRLEPATEVPRDAGKGGRRLTSGADAKGWSRDDSRARDCATKFSILRIGKREQRRGS